MAPPKIYLIPVDPADTFGLTAAAMPLPLMREKNMTKEQFKLTRKSLKFTQKQFAKEIGKSLRSIQNYEYGTRKIPYLVKKYIANYIESKITINLPPMH